VKKAIAAQFARLDAGGAGRGRAASVEIGRASGSRRPRDGRRV